MALQPAEAKHFWDLFRESALFRSWPEFEQQVPTHIEVIELQGNQPLFEAGTPAEHLYLVGEGNILQTYGSAGQLWYQRNLGTGDVLGQRALFAGRHSTRAVAAGPAVVYRLTAADLRRALERNPDLRERLLRDSTASRLHAFPLLESLSEVDVRFLADLLEEVSLPAGSDVPLDAKPGLWLIDWGQVEVEGPADLGEPGMCLTGGNFFTTPGLALGATPGNSAGTRISCSVDKAAAHLNCLLYYLPEQHFRRLLLAFPDMVGFLETPIDIARVLATHVRFLAAPDITDAHVLHLAGFVSWQFVPVGQNISSQGSIGWSYIIIVKGAALISAVDEQGRLRPRNIAPQMYQYGTTSLFEGQFREATVRAVQAQAINGQTAPAGTEVLLLDRRDLQFAFAERPDLWHDGISLFDYFKAQQAKRPHEWLLDGELVVWQGRPHALWLLGPELITVGTLLLLLWALLFLLPVNPAMGLTLLVLFVFGLLPSGWVLVNYLNDYYAVTNRRVTRRDKRPFLWEARIDAPLEMVQDVTVNAGLAGRLFNFGDLTVRTAARGSSIRFDNVPEPDTVRRAILEQRSGALAGARGYTKESLRRAMMRDMSMTLPVPDADYTRALQPDARPPVHFHGWERFQRRLQGRRPSRPLPVPRRGAPRWVRRLASPLPNPVQQWLFGRPLPPSQPITGQVIWRKHPLNLLQRGALGFLALLVLLAALLFALNGGIAQADLFEFFLIWFVLLVIAGAYTWWHVEDWRNDLYVVTEDRIIDIEEKPLGFSTSRRESTLDRVQTVTYRQPTLWANLFGYGDVVILTAGSDDGFTFNMVPRPATVQATVYHKVEAYRRRQDERRQQDTERALLDGLDVYHELGGPEPTRLW